MIDRRPERLVALRKRLVAEELDALLVTQPANVRYLTGFSGSSAVLLVTAAGVLFLSDFRYGTQAAQEVGDLARIEIDSAGWWERMFKLLPEYPAVRTIGYEAHVLSVRDAERLKDPSRTWRFNATSDIVEDQRIVKAPEEIDAIRGAGQVATEALRRATAAVRPGLTEHEVAGILESALRRAGSEGFPFPTIVASGPRTALPHARTSGRVLAPGDCLLLDFGAQVDGYCADISRTFGVGRAPHAELAGVYEIVRAAQAVALGRVRSGMSGRQADALAREPIEAAGYGGGFGHSLGHGLGLEVHEAPRLSQTTEQLLPAGAVVTVEPGVYLPNRGGVRIEDDVVLGPTGAEVLTEFPRDLVVL